MKEDWPILLSFFPDNWVELASQSNALKGLRKDKEAENYIRTLLMHIGCGYSFRETALRARKTKIADITDVGVLGRLRKAKEWLHSLCVALIEHKDVSLLTHSDFPIRLFDATIVKEPGKTGSLWRIHYSIQLPSLICDYFKLTPVKGTGNGESFFQYSIKQEDHIIADGGYSTVAGIHHVVSKKAFVLLRVNTQNLPFLSLNGKPFSLLQNILSIKKAGTIRSWNVLIPNKHGTNVQGRVCAIRKSNEAIKIAHAKLKRKAQKSGQTTKQETLEYAKYVIVFTTYSEDLFSDRDILDWYRIRWQIELTFKRFKSIAQLGHLPKHQEDSSKAWLYGKIFVALLTEKIIDHAESISPWGYFMEEDQNKKSMAGI